MVTWTVQVEMSGFTPLKQDVTVGTQRGRLEV